MAKRLSVKHKKMKLDLLRDTLSGLRAAKHKVAVRRSRKAKQKKADPMN